LKDGELVAEGYDLRFEFGSSSEAGPNRRKEAVMLGRMTG